MKPGIYPGLSFADYLAIPAASSGVVQACIERCPLEAWFDSYLNPAPPVDDDTKLTDTGVVAHAILLEESRSACMVIDPNDYPADKGGAIPAGWTNKSIRAARDAARDAGFIPILKPRMAEIEAVVGGARSFIEELKTSEPAIWGAFQPGGGTSELTMVWDDIGTQCKIRPDRISTGNDLIIDAKFTTTSAEPDAWGRTQLVRSGHYARAAFYQRGVKALTGVECAYVFLVVETRPPYLCSLVGVDPQGMSLGHERVDDGLRVWSQCLDSGIWPGYPRRVCYPELPAYEVARWQERFAVDTTEPPAIEWRT